MLDEKYRRTKSTNAVYKIYERCKSIDDLFMKYKRSYKCIDDLSKNV